MYILIVGAGEVGNYLATILVDEGHDVAVVERDEQLARKLRNELDALVVVGTGVNQATLKQAGVESADLVIAVTEVDEVNLIACMAAKQVGRRELRTIARVREASYDGEDAMSATELGIDMLVGPEQSLAERVTNLLGFSGAGEMRELANGRILLLEMPLSQDSPFVHESLAELSSILPSPSLVIGVYGADGLVIPNGSTRLRSDERVEILTTPENLSEFLILSGRPWHQVRHTLIVGCGTIGFRLAQRLERIRQYPTIIEIDPERARQVAAKLPKSIVLEADGTDVGILKEQLDERADAVVVLLDGNQALLTGAYCKYLGAKKVIVRGENLAYAPIANKLEIDAMLSPRRAVAGAILRFIRRGHFERVVMLGDHEGEIVELAVPANPKNVAVLTKPLREIDFPKGCLVGAVIRAGEVIVANGSTVLAANDTVLMVARTDVVTSVSKVFA